MPKWPFQGLMSCDILFAWADNGGCDIVIYNKKYLCDLSSYFQNRVSKTLRIS